MSTTRYYVVASMDKCAHFKHRDTPQGTFELSYFVDLDDRTGHRAQIDKLFAQIDIQPGPEATEYAWLAKEQLAKWIGDAKLLGPLTNVTTKLRGQYTFSLKVWSDVFQLPELRN